MFEPRALDELIPDWRDRGAPIDTPATEDAFLYLTETGSIRIPNGLLPPTLVGAPARAHGAAPPRAAP